MGLESDGNLINLRIGDEAGLCLLSSQWPEGRTFHPCSVCFLLPFFFKKNKKKKLFLVYLFISVFRNDTSPF